MSEGEGAVAFFSVGGDEEQILRFPGLPLRFRGWRSLLDPQRGEDDAHDGDGQPLPLKIHEEDAPRLIPTERAKLLDLFDPCHVLSVQAQLFARVIESDIVRVRRCDWPVELVAKVGEELRERLDAAEAFDGW